MEPERRREPPGVLLLKRLRSIGRCIIQEHLVPRLSVSNTACMTDPPQHDRNLPDDSGISGRAAPPQEVRGSSEQPQL